MSPASTGTDVSICIPTWQSAAFIASTLRHARSQTHAAVRILVSVDHGDDGTASSCQAVAREDSRVEVFVQDARLGWARNANFLLDRVATDFFFLYFHDDVLAPTYVERMLQAFADRPGLASAHCDMGHFGASGHVSRAVDYPDGIARRLGRFLVAPERGSPLRSLTRTAVRDAGLRLPTDAVDGLWANEPYLFGLLAAGPAAAVPEPLYQRWDKRAGGLTDGWRRLGLQAQYAGFRANIGSCLAILDAAAMTEAERLGVLACLYAHFLHRIRALETDQGCERPLSPGDIHPAFADFDFPGELATLGPQVEAWALARHALAGGVPA